MTSPEHLLSHLELVATGVSAGSRGVCPQLTTRATQMNKEEQSLKKDKREAPITEGREREAEPRTPRLPGTLDPGALSGDLQGHYRSSMSSLPHPSTTHPPTHTQAS